MRRGRRRPGFGLCHANDADRRARRLRVGAPAPRLGPSRGAVGASPPALIDCPTHRRARPLDPRLGPARRQSLFRQPRGRDHADRLLWLPRAKRQQFRQNLGARLRQCSRHGGLPAGERPGHRGGQRLVAGHAARAGLPPGDLRRSLQRVLYRARPRLATASTTTTSTSICCSAMPRTGAIIAGPIPGQPVAEAASEPRNTASIMPIPFVGPGSD